MPESFYLNVLELFSGIGGMHAALMMSGCNGEVRAAADINTVANEVYSHNFPGVKVLRKNIQKLTTDFINKLGVNTILMSPPCQPFTRVGNKKDLDDFRSIPLAHVLNILPELVNVKFVLVENVRGFETSEAGDQLRTTISRSGFEFRELIVNPLQLGIPNSRERYYMIAVKKPLTFDVDIATREELEDKSIKALFERVRSRELPSNVFDILELEDDSSQYDNYLISDDILKRRAGILDIVTKSSKKTCCFTKSYTHYVEGTGSVYCPHDDSVVASTYETASKMDQESEEYLAVLKRLRLRFFTPKEVQRALCFSDSFSYPENVTKKQKYRLLGNSINVDVVSRLIKIMTNCTES